MDSMPNTEIALGSSSHALGIIQGTLQQMLNEMKELRNIEGKVEARVKDQMADLKSDLSELKLCLNTLNTTVSEASKKLVKIETEDAASKIKTLREDFEKHASSANRQLYLISGVTIGVVFIIKNYELLKLFFR